MQRPCACGTHTAAGGECEQCGEKEGPGLQTQLKVNKRGDIYEQEADRIADQVMAAPADRTGSGLPSGLQRFAGQSNRQADTAPASVDQTLASAGRPLKPTLRRDMEQRFDYDFSDVRVHDGAAAAKSTRDVNAHAYTVGPDIVFNPARFTPETYEGQRLIAHELTHVIQQEGGKSEEHPFSISHSGQYLARQPRPNQTSPGNAKKRLDVRTSDRQRQTYVGVTVTGHASPRWRSASSGPQADKLNLELSQKREKAVLNRVEQLFRDALPNHEVVFGYSQQTSFDTDLFNPPAPIDVESSAVGSQQTLQEAGKDARRANAASLRRVDLTITLYDAIDTIQTAKIQEKQRVSGATRDWAIKIGTGMEVEAFAGGGGFRFRLKNRKTNQKVEGTGTYGVVGAGASVPVPTFSTGGYENFSTKQPANFNDFDYKTFLIEAHGFNALLGGWEWSSMVILDLPGGDVLGIDVGGFAVGGAGINLGSVKTGVMWLKGDPPNTYLADVISDEKNYFTSENIEEKPHTVLFETGEAKIPPDQDQLLRDFVYSAVENYRAGGVYNP
ncbi:DUF4157 domain-containing protein [Haloarcula sp. 1CSR25-25]|uniref:eCIS core domain-containing protein n=1 Tax=Haloarcula sp. 1CSR25-25 TaxID=2862545 RepID=UPI0028938D38|nr:DUF4157 domain-containing protein [Haloarcula sp. 1CSR25-25]MDT3437436.1 DUF4157 domain-containing protein [Haloarcula sp. 1CSR25-25]